MIDGRTMVFSIGFVTDAGFEWPGERHGALFPMLLLKSKIRGRLQPFLVEPRVATHEARESLPRFSSFTRLRRR
jgi:hypothetical protein